MMFKECFVVLKTELYHLVNQIEFTAQPLAVFYSFQEAVDYKNEFSEVKNGKIEISS